MESRLASKNNFLAAAKAFLRNAAAEITFRTPLLSRFQASSSPEWRILTYHRVIRATSVSYPLQPGMCVTPETFAEHMRYLRAHCNVVSLENLVSAITAKEHLPPRTVVVTFDDGWKDNYDHAFPILKQENIPATICLATSFIGTKETFWTDRLIQAITGFVAHSEFRDSVHQRIEALACPRDSKNALLALLHANPDSDLRPLSDALIENLKRLTRAVRRPIVSEVVNLSKEFSEVPSERSFMNWDEVKEMRRAGISFISHSHHHFEMAELEEEQLSDEVLDSFQSFRESGIEPLKYFAYPGGSFNALCQQVLKDRGITIALTTNRESNLNAGPRLLGRINMHEDVSATPARFAARLWVPHF